MEKHVGTELTTEGARSTQKPKDNGTGINKMLAQYEIIVGTVWPHLRAKVSRRRLKKATPAGPKKPWGSNFASWGVPNELESSWGVLGARSASGGRSGRNRVVDRYYRDC